MELSVILAVLDHCHRGEHTVNAAGVVIEPVCVCDLYARCLVQLSFTSPVYEFREHLGLNWKPNYSVIPVSAALITVLITEPD